jgi:uncharacterized protein YyaL (SSP411 family)
MFMADDGALYLRPAEARDLIVRPKSEHDEAVPAPASILAHNLLRLERLTGEQPFRHAGEMALKALSSRMAASPEVMASAMSALDYHSSDKIEIVVVGEGAVRDAMLKEVYRSYLPNCLIAVGGPGADTSTPLFEGRVTGDGQARAYLCRNSVCQLPVTTAAQLKEQLSKLKGGREG